MKHLFMLGELLGFVEVTLFKNLRFSRMFERSRFLTVSIKSRSQELLCHFNMSKFYHEIMQSLSYLRCKHFGRCSLFFWCNLLFIWAHSHASSRSWIKFHLVSFRSGSEILDKKKGLNIKSAS